MNLAAFWNNLLDFNFTNIFHAITHAHWSNVWAAVSAIFTVLTAIIAGWALFQWSRQEKLKAKQEFKKTVCHYAYALAQMPPAWTQTPENPELEDPTVVKKRDELNILFSKCTYAWFLSEGLFSKNRVVKENWNLIVTTHTTYMKGKPVEEHDIMEACMKIIKNRFIF